MDQCEMCGANVHELRRGRCWGCYSRWVDTRPVGLGACCRFCGERRRGQLKAIELLGNWVPSCHNCAARIAQLPEMPRTLAAVRDALDRERRGGLRRYGKQDGRVFPYERRDRDRRSPRLGRGTGAGDALPPEELDLLPLVEDDMILEIEELAEDLASLAAELPGGEGGGEVQAAELTRIHQALTPDS